MVEETVGLLCYLLFEQNTCRVILTPRKQAEAGAVPGRLALSHAPQDIHSGTERGLVQVGKASHPTLSMASGSSIPMGSRNKSHLRRNGK